MKNKYFLNPTDLLFRPAEIDGSMCGVIEDAHGGVTVYRTETAATAALCAHLKYDGNAPLVVDGLDTTLAQTVEAIRVEPSSYNFSVQDPNYAGWYENICFFDTAAEEVKWHTIQFVEYLSSHKLLEQDIDLEAAYAEYVNSRVKN